MNKQVLFLGCAIGCATSCYSEATNMMERAQSLYTPEIVANPQINMQGNEYQQFVCDLSYFVRSATQDEIIALESYLVSTITTLVVQVSTNEVRQGVDLCYIEWRGESLWDIMIPFRNQDINTNICLDITRYLGRIKRTPFPEDLAHTRRSDTYWYPDPEKMAKKKAEIEAWWRKRNHQYRVYCDNSSVDNYRQELLRGCGETLPHCQEIMSPEAFVAFTNEMVKASNATLEEQKLLFRRLNHD